MKKVMNAVKNAVSRKPKNKKATKVVKEMELKEVSITPTEVKPTVEFKEEDVVEEEVEDEEVIENIADAPVQPENVIEPVLTGRLANRAARGKLKPKVHARGR